MRQETFLLFPKVYSFNYYTPLNFLAALRSRISYPQSV